MGRLFQPHLLQNRQRLLIVILGGEPLIIGVNLYCDMKVFVCPLERLFQNRKGLVGTVPLPDINIIYPMIQGVQD